MEVIIEGSERVFKLLGKQRIRKTNYRLMKYVLKAESNERVLLHNVITGQRVCLSEEEANALDGTSIEPAKIIEPLIESYYLVPSDFDEKGIVNTLRLLMKRLFPPKGINHYLILTTTHCNARCWYCFEKSVQHIHMPDSIGEEVVAYIVAHKSKNHVKLHWFGGEPLVGVARIDQICNGLSEHGIDFESVMTSNGYLFTEQMIVRAVKDWKLKLVQITFDGTEKAYNKIKAYVTEGDNPYLKVVHNVALLLEAGIHVTIRLNNDGQNADDLKVLIREFKNLFSDNTLLSVYASQVTRDTECSGITCNPDKVKQHNVQVTELNTYISDMGLFTPSLPVLSLMTNSCMADNDETIVILPDGRLAKCESIRDDEVLGCIDSEEENSLYRHYYKETKSFDYCGECPLYPACILLKACPTKKMASQAMCKNSIEQYILDMIKHYERLYKTGK